MRQVVFSHHTFEYQYHIFLFAQKAKIPIVPLYMDYAKKEVGYFDVLYPTGDLQKDLEIIENYYKDVKGKHPKQFNPKIY